MLVVITLSNTVQCLVLIPYTQVSSITSIDQKPSSVGPMVPLVILKAILGILGSILTNTFYFNCS